MALMSLLKKNHTVNYNCYYRNQKYKLQSLQSFPFWKKTALFSLLFISSYSHLFFSPLFPSHLFLLFQSLPFLLFQLLVEFFHIWIDKVQDIFFGSICFLFITDLTLACHIIWRPFPQIILVQLEIFVFG